MVLQVRQPQQEKLQTGLSTRRSLKSIIRQTRAFAKYTCKQSKFTWGASAAVAQYEYVIGN